MYKNHQLAQIILPIQNNEIEIFIDSLAPVDKLRFSCFGKVDQGINRLPGVLIWSDLVNNYIGSFSGSELVDPPNGTIFTSQMEPLEGIEFWNVNKIILNNSYRFKLFDFLGNPLVNTYTGEIYILIEWFIY
mgnify:CR=1 FL=1